MIGVPMDCDLRHLLGEHVPRQGPRPLCLPFAVSGVHAGARAGDTTEIEDLAPEALWRDCVCNGKASNGGTTLSAVDDALRNPGQPAASVWPYNSSLGAGTENPPPTAAAAKWHKHELVPVSLRHDGCEQEIQDQLALGRLVVVIVELTSEFWAAAADGTVAVPPVTAPPGDYHAVIAAGVGTREPGLHSAFLIRNSWGTLWAAGGYAWLPIDYLRNFAVQAAVIRPTGPHPEREDA